MNENQKEQSIIKERFIDFSPKLNRYVIGIINSFNCEEEFYY